jgi:transposase InsO family protein
VLCRHRRSARRRNWCRGPHRQPEAIQLPIGGRTDSPLAALNAAIALRQPPRGCVHHGDRGSQYAAETYRDRLREAKLVGSMGWRDNPYDNAMLESLMKTLKVAGVYPLEGPTGRSA